MPDRPQPQQSGYDRRDRVEIALCRFLIPGSIVPRAEMTTAVLAAVDHPEDFLEYLPAKRVVVDVDALRAQAECFREALEKIMATPTARPLGDGSHAITSFREAHEIASTALTGKEKQVDG